MENAPVRGGFLTPFRIINARDFVQRGLLRIDTRLDIPTSRATQVETRAGRQREAVGAKGDDQAGVTKANFDGVVGARAVFLAPNVCIDRFRLAEDCQGLVCEMRAEIEEGPPASFGLLLPESLGERGRAPAVEARFEGDEPAERVFM